MRKPLVIVCCVTMVAGVLFVPYPTKIAADTKVQFLLSDGQPLSGLDVTQDWECFGLFGKGHTNAATDGFGAVRFPPRMGYGTVATRIIGRLLPFVSVHSSYSANVTLIFFVESPLGVDFAPPLFRRREPFSSSGSYLDSTGRNYWSRESGAGELVEVSGDFMHNSNDIKITIKQKHPKALLPPAAVRGTNGL